MGSFLISQSRPTAKQQCASLSRRLHSRYLRPCTANGCRDTNRNTAPERASRYVEIRKHHVLSQTFIDRKFERFLTVLDAVRRHGVKRLVIDGLSGFQQAALEPERVIRYWSALSNELRAQGVTTLHPLEMPALMGAD